MHVKIKSIKKFESHEDSVTSETNEIQYASSNVRYIIHSVQHCLTKSMMFFVNDGYSIDTYRKPPDKVNNRTRIGARSDQESPSSLKMRRKTTANTKVKGGVEFRDVRRRFSSIVMPRRDLRRVGLRCFSPSEVTEHSREKSRRSTTLRANVACARNHSDIPLFSSFTSAKDRRIPE